MRFKSSKTNTMYKRHGLIIVSMVFLSLFLIILFNIFVDYTGVFSLREGVSRIEVKTDNRRLVLPGVIEAYKPKCIITGTSRVGRSINPNYEAIQDENCLNLFLNAGDAYEISKLLDFANNTVADLETVYLGVDFFMFDTNLDVASYQNRFKEENYVKTPILRKIFNNPNVILSKDAIKNNLSVLGRTMYDFSQIQEMTFHDKSSNKKISDIDAIYSYSKQIWNIMRKGGHGYHGYILSDSKMNALVSTIEKLDGNGITVNIMINPVHVYLTEVIEQAGYLEQYSKIIEKISGLASRNVNIYDFSGYNSVTSQHYYNDFNCYPDAGHYSVEVGNAMINIIKGKMEPEDKKFGRRLNKILASEYMKARHVERQKWKSKYNFDYKIIRDVMACTIGGKDKSCVSEIVLQHYKAEDNIRIKNKKIYNRCVELKPSFLHSENYKIKSHDKKVNEYKVNLASKIDKLNRQMPMMLVPGGDFIMGSSKGKGLKNEIPQRKVNLGSFQIDKYETTVSEFLSLGFKPKIDYSYSYEFPIAGVTWRQAQLYCEVLGKRLPTEAEWEKAARGLDTKRYPWGDSWPDCNRANFNGDPGVGCGSNNPVKPGSKVKGGSPYGVFDMAGNVFEYVSIADDSSNIVSSEDNISVKKNNEGTAIIKGGSFYSEPQDLRISLRRYVDKEFAAKYIGFRCAKSFKH